MCDKKITGNKCGTCFFWLNFPDIPYNKIHKNVKDCGKGNITTPKGMACDKYKISKKERKKINFKRGNI